MDNDLQLPGTNGSGSPISIVPFSNLIDKINSILLSSVSVGQRVSFWGAGHRSLTLISQIQNQFTSSIVDSAPFKQTRYCPDTGQIINQPSS